MQNDLQYRVELATMQISWFNQEKYISNSQKFSKENISDRQVSFSELGPLHVVVPPSLT